MGTTPVRGLVGNKDDLPGGRREERSRQGDQAGKQKNKDGVDRIAHDDW